jgi:SAM-dependent methyltransferase
VWQDADVKGNFVFQKEGFSTLPFQTGSFDMSWNFASLWFVRELEEFLTELARVTKHIIFICIPNKRNALSMLVSDTRKHPDVFPKNIAPATLKRIMGKAGWSCLEQGFFDVPPWPDIAMKKEDLLRTLGFKRLAKKLEDREIGSICILDYYNGNKKHMAKTVFKYAYLEDLPNILKQFWAHHRYFIFVPW